MLGRGCGAKPGSGMFGLSKSFFIKAGVAFRGFDLAKQCKSGCFRDLNFSHGPGESGHAIKNNDEVVHRPACHLDRAIGMGNIAEAFDFPLGGKA